MHGQPGFFWIGLLALCGSVPGIQGNDIQDGIYFLNQPGQGQKVAAGGTEVWLGKLASDQLGEISLYSLNNQNTQYLLRLDRCGPLQTDQQLVSLTAIVIDGVCAVVSGHSGGPGQETGEVTLTAQLQGEAVAEQIAKHLDIGVQKRRHPGHCLLVTWTPVRESFGPDDAVELELEIRNVGDVPIVFLDGGQQRGARNNQFNFTCFHQLKPVPDVGNPIHFGGLAAIVDLQPGQSFQKRVDLRDWYSFNEVGVYDLIGSFYLGIHESQRAHRLVWEDYATGPGQVTIVIE